jgi:hypothetical protein
MKAKRSSTSLVKNKNSKPTKDNMARTMVRSRKRRRGGDNFLRMLAEFPGLVPVSFAIHILPEGPRTRFSLCLKLIPEIV